jgi:signal transduction histidine kinase
MTYVGHDRRGGARIDATTFGLSYFFACAAVFAVVVVAAVMAFRTSTSPTDVGAASSGLLIPRMAICSITAAVCLVHWRLSGVVTSLLIAVGLLLIGPVYVGINRLAPLVIGQRPSATAAAVMFVAVGLLLYAAWGHEVDDRARLPRVATWVVAGTAVAALLLRVLAPESVVATIDQVGPSDGWAALLTLAFAGTWLALAVRCLLPSPHRSSSLLPWLALMAVARGLHEATRGLGALRGHVIGDADEVLLLVGGLCVLWGVGRDLLVHVTTQRQELFVTQLSRDRAEAAIEAVRFDAEERAHEARNALMAIEGATRTLDRHHDRLPPAMRTELAGAIAAEVARLQRIITGAPEETCRSFGIAEALAPAFTAARSRGLDVVSHVGLSILALGSWSKTSEVVHNLLENARCHAPGSVVTIDSLVADGWVMLRVSDRGPGVPPSHRAAVFERSFRCPGTVSPGTGLGLYIAQRSMREQGGDIWLEDGPGGGTSFILGLPAAPSEDAASGDRAGAPHPSGPAVDGDEDVFELAHVVARLPQTIGRGL